MTSMTIVETPPTPRFCKLGSKCEILPAVKCIPYKITFSFPEYSPLFEDS